MSEVSSDLAAALARFEFTVVRSKVSSPQSLRLWGRVPASKEESFLRILTLQGSSPHWTQDVSIHVWEEGDGDGVQMRFAWRIVYQAKQLDLAELVPQLVRALHELSNPVAPVESLNDLEVPLVGAPSDRNAPTERGRGARATGIKGSNPIPRHLIPTVRLCLALTYTLPRSPPTPSTSMLAASTWLRWTRGSGPT